MKLKDWFRRLLFGEQMLSVANAAGSGSFRASVAERQPEFAKDGYLQYLENGVRVRLDLDKRVTKVGRSNSMDCCLEDPRVSGGHALFIRNKEGHYYVKDVSSDGETYLNGERISGTRSELKPGYEVRLATVRMIFGRRSVAEDSPADVGGKVS